MDQRIDIQRKRECCTLLHKRMWCGGVLKMWVLGIGTSSLHRSKYWSTLTAASTSHLSWPSAPFMIHHSPSTDDAETSHTQASFLSKLPGPLCPLQKNPVYPPDEIWLQVIQCTHTQSVGRHEVTYCYTALSVGITLAGLYPWGNQ